MAVGKEEAVGGPEGVWLGFDRNGSFSQGGVQSITDANVPAHPRLPKTQENHQKFAV